MVKNELGMSKTQIKEVIKDLINDNQLEKARELISRFEKNEADDVEIYSMKAVIMIMEGNLAGAEKVVKEGLEIDGNNCDLLYNLAYIYENSDRLDKSFKHECVICGNKFNSFIPWPWPIADRIKKYEITGSDLINYQCPYCGCNDRLRHLVLFFNKLNIWDNFVKGEYMLHIAPEIILQKAILSASQIKYISGDLFPDPNNDNIQEVDITDIKYPDEYFDFIICNHVLEHVQDDIKAISELFRVLKKGGKAILQTPYSPKIRNSYEDWSITTEKGRLEFFGQGDHVRIYGLDLFDRLQSVGFTLNIVKSAGLFTQEEARYYGFNNDEDLIIVIKE